MLQPISLQLAHFNVEQNAQISKDAIAVAQQTAQGQEVVQDNLKRTQKVQASAAAAEAQKVRRRTEEEKERRRGGQRGSFNSGEESSEEEKRFETELPELPKKAAPKAFDLYA